MNDWNKNGKSDAGDFLMDMHANQQSEKGNHSNFHGGWLLLLILIAIFVIYFFVESNQYDTTNYSHYSDSPVIHTTTRKPQENDGIVKYTNAKKYTNSHKHEKNPYYVYDYEDAEDFYEDNREDFDGYEDAEDYYDEAWEE